MRIFIALILSLITTVSLAQTYSMPGGTVNTCSGTFYDTGGAGGPYSNGEFITFTICPDTPGSMISLDFTAFAVETGFDALCVFNGPTTGSPSFGCYDSSVPLLGIVQSTDPSGCLTFQFDSDFSITPAGWAATISCTAPCQTVISDPSFSIAGDPIKICQGDAVDFFGDGLYPDSGTGYVQSDATSTFTWYVKDNTGTTTYVGEDQSLTFPDPGIYVVSLVVTDINGCQSTNATNQEIWVSTTPIFAGTTPVLPDICLGETNDLLGVATPPTETLTCIPGVTGVTSLPDGSGVSYSTSTTLDCYDPGSTITSAASIESICITMEHSYAGDLDIEIQCPDGTTISLVDYLGPGLDWEFLGEPVDDDGSATVGVGYTYCFTEGATATDSWADIGAAPPTYSYTDADGTPVVAHEHIPAGDYLPADPFAGLIGCPANGDWTIIITDNLGSDDGTIFDWSITLAGIPAAGVSTFTPIITDCIWTPAGEVTATAGCDATVLPTATGLNCYTLTVEDDFGCFYDTSVCFTVLPSPIVDDIADVTACDSYTLPVITGTDLTGGEAYYTGTGGTGTMYTDGTVITTTTTLFIYDQMAAPPNCEDEETFTITIVPTPNIDDIPDVVACDTYTLPAITGTDLTGGEAYYTGPGGTGTSYTPGAAITATVSPLYIYDATAGPPVCSDEETFNITINTTPVAGPDNASTLCNSAGTTLDLDGLLVGADAGGTWTETTGLPSGGFTPGTGVLDASGVTAGVYTFDYTVTGIAPCPDDIATITITIEDEVTAGPDNASTLCNSAGTTLDLDGLLVGADPGTWTETSGTPSGGFTPGTGVLDASGVTAGTYTFDYTVTGTAPCPDDIATITITIEDEVTAGPDNASTLCNSAGTTLDLDGLLVGADAGGTWAETSGTGSGGFTPGTGVLDASGVTAGTYTFDYTVTGTAPCPDDIATITITIEDEVTAGPDNASTLCNSAGTTLDLDGLLVGADPGTWTETSGTPSGGFTPGTGVLDASGVTAGTYTFDYTVTGTAPCPDDIATITITIEDEVTAGPDNASTLCNSAGITLDLDGLLVGADAGGTWVETSGTSSGGFTPGTGVLDASGVTAGTYTFDYTVTGTAPCPDDIATITITIEDEVTAGPDNASTLCNSAGSTLDLDGLLVGADAGGTWVETTGTPSGGFTPGTGVLDASGVTAGVYTFDYTVAGTAPCPDDIATMTITISDNPDAGADNVAVLCNSAGSTIDLNTLLVGADAGGTWVETTASGAFTPGTGVLDASGLAAGTYDFTYTVTGIAPCVDDVADFSITVTDLPTAGADNAASLCNSALTTLDLNTLLDATADAGGTWTETSGAPSGGFTPASGMLDASGVTAGTYTFEYSIPAVGPCPGDVAEMTITIEQEADAGADNAAVLCNTAGSTIDLNTLLVGADAGGTWVETTASGAFTPGTGVFDASGLAAGTYDFTYTVTGVAPCVDDVADFSITVTDLPNAGADNAASLCNSALTTLDLNTLLDATADAGGTWTETSGTPSGGFTPASGMLDASGVTAGTYTFEYSIPAVGPCPGDVAEMTITIEQEVNAGADNALALCNTAGTTIDLNTLLDATADAGGTWVETSGTGSGGFTPGTGVLDASGVAAGTYTFDYTMTAVAPCADDVATMTITIEQEVNAGADNALALCNTAGTTIDLNTLLDATADVGGTWVETSGTASGSFTPASGVLDASGVTAGTYTFEYTVTAVAPCVDDVAIMTITIEQEVVAGADNALALCNAAGTTIDLNTLLDATADAGGTWVETSGTGSGGFTPGTGVLDASGVAAGTYTFDYTVTAVAPCVDDVATMTITIEQEAVAGADNSSVMCNTAGSTLDLNTLLDATAAVGTWAETTGSGAFTPGTGVFDASGLAAGTYDFTYTVTGVAPCVDDVADFSITVTDLPNAGADNAAALCNIAGTTIDLNSLLDATADAGGTWSETSGTPSGSFTPASGILDASGVAAGTYTFVYDIPAVGPCPGDFATMTITIEQEVVAGADNALALCNTAGTTIDLNTLLDATADAGGTWVETSGTGSGGFTPGTGVLDASGVAAGTYTFDYTMTAVAPCADDVATMTITIEQEVNAGADNALALCNTAGTTIDLNTLLDATADVGGTWVETSGTASGSFTPASGVLDASGVTAGTYTFEYTVTAVAPCVDDVAIMTITIEQEVVAGADNALALCNAAGTTIDLNTLLDATADAGGTWVETSGTGSGGFTPGTGVLDASGVAAGTYTFDYTVTAVAPCVDDVATMTITIEQEAVAGADNSSVMCNTAGSTLDLNTLLDATAAVGTWAETTGSGAFTPGTGVFDASGLAAGTYDFTYTVTGVAPCVDDVADFSITVTDLPNAGADNAAALCNIAGTTIDLNSLLDATADAGGTWSETSGTPSGSFTPASGVLDASGVAAGTYTFVYDIPAVGPCPGDFATMTITIEQEVVAGADNALALCNIAGTTIDLNTLLDATADAGGTWVETSGTGSGGFTPGTGVLDASGVAAGTYTFDYTMTAVAPCADDVATMTITIEQEVNAGADNALALCNTAGTTIDLNTLLDATADVGGTWVETSGTASGSFTPASGVLDASGVTAGTYTFEYTVTAVAPCVDDVAIMTITIEQEVVAGADNALALCNAAGTTIDLNTLLDATADAGGTWVETSGTGSGGFTPGTGVLDASGVTAGTYTFDYTVTAVAPCVDDVATMTITIEQEVNAGVDNASTLCNSAGSTIDLNTLLEATADLGGTWVETSASGAFTPATGVFDGSGLAAGDYTFTYTVTAVAPCVDDVADFTITVTNLPTAGADNAQSLCNSAGTTLDLNSLLAGADAGGSWSETSGTPSGGFTPLTGSLDASGVTAGTYTFEYNVPAAGPCPGDIAVMTITIEQEVNAGTDNAASLCNAAGTTIDLNTLLDATADAGGTWVETSGAASGGFTPGTGVLDASGVTAGTYTFDYTMTAVAPCVDDAVTMTITIEQEVNAGADNVASLCNTTGTTLDLNTLLDATADLGGTWTETSGTASGTFTPGTGILDASSVTAGTYTFEYLVTAVAPCADDFAIMTITIEQEVRAGTDNATSLCNTAGTTLDLNTLLTGADAGGAWAETTGIPSGGFTPASGVLDASGVTAGVYTFDYTMTAVAPCVNDLSTMTITIEQEANAGADNAAVLCNTAGSTLDLNTLLVGADAGGAWVETTGYGSFDPGTGLFDASGIPGGLYTFTYTVTGVAPCGDDVADFTVTVNEMPTIDPIADMAICNENLLAVPGFTSDIAGSIIDWTVTTGVNIGFGLAGSGNIAPFTAINPTMVPIIATVEAIPTSPEGCIGDPISFNITVNPTPNVLFTADVLAGCVGHTVTFDNLSTPSGTDCIWNLGDGTTASGCGSISHTYNSAGLFDVTLIVTSAEGCSDTLTVTDYVNISEFPVAAFTFPSGIITLTDTEVEFENESINADTYLWNFGDFSPETSVDHPTHEFPSVAGGNYVVTLIAENENGCTDTTTRIIVIKDILLYYVPNAFTPDGNDVNQEFKPVITAGIDIYDYHLTIFNRWGEIVFESYDPGVGWDGTYATTGLVLDEVYVWQLEFGETMSDKKHYERGTVSVLR